MLRSRKTILTTVAKRIILLFMVALFIATIQPCQAGILSDDFNDGNADGWVFPFNDDLSQGPGIWNVEDGTLVQRFFGDGNSGLVDNLFISDQVIEVTTKTKGYTGVVLWYNQVNTTWANYVAVGHNYQTGMWVAELIAGQGPDGYGYSYSYGGPWIGGDTWFNLRVVADSVTGNLAVYVDGVYLFTHPASTPYRTGLSGVNSSNEVGYFDNFRVTSDDVPFDIDIKPGDALNSINLKSKTVTVAILSTPDFYAPDDVNQATLTFGFKGDETSWQNCSRKAKDVNADTLKDLVCTFSVKTALKCNATEDYTKGILRGQTNGGILFEQYQDIATIPPSSCIP